MNLKSKTAGIVELVIAALLVIASIYLLVSQSYVFGIILLVLGLALCYYGYKTYKEYKDEPKTSTQK